MQFRDAILLLHPVLAIALVFPILGIVLQRAVQTRQRRLQIAAGEKSKLPIAGPEHVQLGRWLASSVVGVILVALANDVGGHLLDANIWAQHPLRVVLLGAVWLGTVGALALLLRAQNRLWRGLGATCCGMGLVILGCQDGVYRKTEQWYISHYYYGMAAAFLMIFSLAILREIYQDRSNRWRGIHIGLNSLALLLFIGQGVTGTLSLLEVPLHWQEAYVQKLYEHRCDQQPCTVQPAAVQPAAVQPAAPPALPPAPIPPANPPATAPTP